MHDGEDTPEQDSLLPELTRARETARRAQRRTAAKERTKPAVTPAATDPVARVLVDVPLAHLDRPFDYLVPETMADGAVPGARVKVRFAGQDVDGFVLERCAESDHPGRLAPLRRVVSAEPVLSPAVADLSAAVAARYAGTRSDVLRLAVPSRHATVEKQDSAPAPRIDPAADPAADPASGAAPWADYQGGAAFLRALREGGVPRAVWTALPPGDWTAPLAAAVAATYAGGRGALVCVPDHRDVARLDRALTVLLGAGHHVVLTADLGPSARYRAYLAVSRGAVRVVVGTRAAAFAPVHDLGLVAIWDDGDDLHAEPRAPYPHVREVLLHRAAHEGAAALVGGYARTVEGEYLLRTGWAAPLTAPRTLVRRRVPQVAVTGATDRDLERDPHARTARLPRAAFDTIRAALQTGPVLLQTPRHGYVTSLACDTCRTPARCTACAGPLALGAAHDPPACRWCGTAAPAWTCPACGGRGLRAPVRGDRRTAEEVGRAFPQVTVRTSSGDRVLDEVPADPAIVVATPGAEPVAPGGYACVVLLDTWLMLARPDLRTTEESLRRWLGAAALARGGEDEGRVLAVGDSADPVLQALVRWDPAGFAARELDDRRSAHLPPASRLATLTGPEEAVDAALASLTLPEGAEVLGPTPVETTGPRADGDDTVRLVVRVPRAAGERLSRALVELQGVRSARKLEPVRVQVDPIGLG